MSKKLLQRTKNQFVAFTALLPDATWYELVTTPYNGRTEIARFRRMFVRTFNNLNHRQLRATTTSPDKEQKETA